MRHAHAIATRAAALAIIAGTGLMPLTPITAHADTTSTQPAANTDDKFDEDYSIFTVDKTRTFKCDKNHRTVTCIAADYPKEIIFFYSHKQASQPNLDIEAADILRPSAIDTQTTIDGRTIKGKTYTVPLAGEKLTLNCYKAGDFFANLKVTWNGVQATINPYGADGVNDDTANQYAYSSGAANINTSFADDHQLTDTDDIHIEGIPTGWTAKDKKNTPGDVSSLSPDGINSYTAIYEYTNPEYPGNTYRLYINRVNTPPQPTIQATDAPAPAPADTPQLVQTGVEQAGAATALFASAAIAANTIARRKRK